jgi:hypothetical protein
LAYWECHEVPLGVTFSRVLVATGSIESYHFNSEQRGGTGRCAGGPFVRHS